MAKLDSIIQPVVKAPAQRVDGVIDTTPAWLNDSDLVGAYSLYDLYGSGNDIMQLSGSGGTQRIDFTQEEYENINSGGQGLPSSLIVLDKLYNQVPGSSNSDLSETTGNLSNRPSVAYRPYNRFDYVLFATSGQHTGHVLSMSNLTNLSLTFDGDVTFIVVAQNNLSSNDVSSTYPFVAGFQYAQSMGLSADDDFRGLTVVDTAGPMYMQARAHQTSSTASEGTSSTSAYFVTSAFGTYAGTFKSKNSVFRTCDERKMYSTISSTTDLALGGTNSTDVQYLGSTSDSSIYHYLSIGGRRGGLSTSNQDRMQMDFKALLVFKKVMTNDEINTVADGLRGVVL
tara:strand:- start:296 stop:1318 length:1023 start_codon:yes stop_codon:yes gene_type:complete